MQSLQVPPAALANAIVNKLIEKNASVVAMVDSSKAVNNVASQLAQRTKNTAALSFMGDVTSRSFRESVFQQLQGNYGVVKICIPAAGILRNGLSVKQNRQKGEIRLYDEDDFSDIMHINLQRPTY